jgi:hypothetical protein
MSLWLQSVLAYLAARDYAHVRGRLLPIAPIALPGCLERELAFAERRCADPDEAGLFPVRFLWTLEALEQRNFGHPPGRSHYHPEKLLANWERARRDAAFRSELESARFVLDFDEQAIELTRGWVFVGDRFVDDFLEIEATVGVELLFSAGSPGAREPAFREHKRRTSHAPPPR